MVNKQLTGCAPNPIIAVDPERCIVDSAIADVSMRLLCADVAMVVRIGFKRSSVFKLAWRHIPKGHGQMVTMPAVLHDIHFRLPRHRLNLKSRRLLHSS